MVTKKVEKENDVKTKASKTKAISTKKSATATKAAVTKTKAAATKKATATKKTTTKTTATKKTTTKTAATKKTAKAKTTTKKTAATKKDVKDTEKKATTASKTKKATTASKADKTATKKTAKTKTKDTKEKTSASNTSKDSKAKKEPTIEQATIDTLPSVSVTTTMVDDASVDSVGKTRRRQHKADTGVSKDNNTDKKADEKSDKSNNDKKQGAKSSDKDKASSKDKAQEKNSKKSEPSPSETPESLMSLTHDELLQKADELDILTNEINNLKKDELAAIIFKAIAEAEGFKKVHGILDILSDGYGFMRCKDYMPSEIDVYVSVSMIRKNGLRKGDEIKGETRPPRDGEKYAALASISSVNGVPMENFKKRPRFADLTPVFPDERLVMEHGPKTVTARVIDLVAPIGKGQRGLIVSPPKAGKTTILKDIAAAISANNPEVHLMCLLVDERPEEVTDMERSINGEVISSTFDMPCENHIAIAELTIERAKRLVESGRDVVILLDSITRLARAYNLAQPPSGRVLSGGVDSTALYPPKRFLGAARNIEGGGSLTILASALIETGSKMDEVIFEEFKGTGNMELKLDRNLADRRIFPAIDPITSGTRKEDLLLNPQEAPLIWAVRRILANLNNTERAMDMLIKSLNKTPTNQDFLIRTAKKASKGAGIDSVSGI